MEDRRALYSSAERCKADLLEVSAASFKVDFHV
jgi:hypothetical protein